MRTRKWVLASDAAWNSSKMSASRSPTWTHRAASPSSRVGRVTFSNQRTLSFCSIGTVVGLIVRLAAFVPLNPLRDQNLTAANPSGSPSGVTTRLERKRSPRAVWAACRPFTYDRYPTASGVFRVKLNSVVLCNTRIVPVVAVKRPAVAATCPARVAWSSTRGLSMKRFAALVAAESWHAIGSVRPMRSPKSPSRCPRRAFSHSSGNSAAASSRSTRASMPVPLTGDRVENHLSGRGYSARSHPTTPSCGN
jgi:hypothetical protein